MNRWLGIPGLVLVLSAVFLGWKLWHRPHAPITPGAISVVPSGAETASATTKVTGMGQVAEINQEAEILSYELEQLLNEPVQAEQWVPDPHAVSTLREEMENGDPRTPPLATSPEREMPTAEELSDPDAYLAYQARQQQAVYQSFIAESEKKVTQLAATIKRAEEEGGVTAEQLQEGKEKLQRLEALRAQLIQKHPEAAASPDDADQSDTSE